MDEQVKILLTILTISVIITPIGLYFEKKKDKMGKKPWHAYDSRQPINNPADWLFGMGIFGIIGSILLLILELLGVNI